MDFAYRHPDVQELKFSGHVEAALRKSPELGRKLATIAKKLHELRGDSRASQSKLLDYYEDRSGSYKEGAADWFQKNRTSLEDSTTPAGLVIVAARNILGPGLIAWEPDSVRIELEDRQGLKVPPVNFDKLFATVTLLEIPAFYQDALTFQNTVQVFNHQLSDPDIVHEVTPAEIAWAVFEAETILHENLLFEPDFDDEPTLYTAAVMHRAGYVMSPGILDFAQPALEQLNEKNLGVSIDEVRAAWNDLVKDHSWATRTYSESPLDVQLARLAAVQTYLSDGADDYLKRLESFPRGP